MGHLFFIRHGQASFLTENYDKLSELGVLQSQRLGEYWLDKGWALDQIIAGPCVRQRETADVFANAYQGTDHSSRLRYEIYEEFAEYSGDDVLDRGLKQLLEHDQEVFKLHQAFQAASGRVERHATFQRLFERVLTDWVRGIVQAPSLEPWESFCARVDSGIARAVEASSSKRIAIFTSGGPIAIAMRRALQLSSEITIQTSFMCRNASWSEFLYSASGRFTLSAFNVTSHLDGDKRMLTYR